MASIKTEITEIVTGLALLGHHDLDHALSVRPRVLHNVTDTHFERLSSARECGDHTNEFETAWANGLAFAMSTDGLRGRPPWRLEWKGPHRPPGYEQVPADLRVDHVYLISCKYGSNILFNASPAHVFDRLLAERRGARNDWFAEVAPEAYQDLYAACCRDLGLHGLPPKVSELDREGRQTLRRALGNRTWPTETLASGYQWLATAVSHASAERWIAKLGDPLIREEMLWRLLRLSAVPYFVLGAAADRTPLRYRVGTPWDFRQAFVLKSFDVWGDAAGQPIVRWRADVHSREDDTLRAIEGHVEIRWSHGRFAQAPEAKVYLDTPHHLVAGYFPVA